MNSKLILISIVLTIILTSGCTNYRVLERSNAPLINDTDDNYTLSNINNQNQMNIPETNSKLPQFEAPGPYEPSKISTTQKQIANNSLNGTLIIISNPSRASIYLTNYTNLSMNTPANLSLIPNSYGLYISLSNYSTNYTYLLVKSNETININITLIYNNSLVNSSLLQQTITNNTNLTDTINTTYKLSYSLICFDSDSSNYPTINNIQLGNLSLVNMTFNGSINILNESISSYLDYCLDNYTLNEYSCNSINSIEYSLTNSTCNYMCFEGYCLSNNTIQEDNIPFRQSPEKSSWIVWMILIITIGFIIVIINKRKKKY